LSGFFGDKKLAAGIPAKIQDSISNGWKEHDARALGLDLNHICPPNTHTTDNLCLASAIHDRYHKKRW
jgi:hypothetical protein